MSNWQPLESNSELITKYVADLGLDTKEYVFQDLLSYEEWAQQMIGQPALGLLFIYEITEIQDKFSKEQTEKITKEGQKVSPALFYMKQYAENACGTIAVFHILGNLPIEQRKLIKEGSILERFFAKAKGMNPEEAGNIFEAEEDIKQKHVHASNEGHTNVNDHLNTNNHFIAMVRGDDHLYELDGRKNHAINHGPTTAANFLADACKAAHTFIEREPDNLNAGLIVFAPKSEE